MEEDFSSHQAKIVVFGCGGGGSNTINRLTNIGVGGAKTIAANTDARHLKMVNAHKKILIGKDLTRGLGAGGYAEVGKKAAEESREIIKEELKDADLVFVTCGLGGGTGTGSSPVVAKLAKEQGAIVIGAVTLPFKIEGSRIMKAEDGLVKLREVCDTVIVIENQKLLQLAGNKPLTEAFGVADNLIATMIKGITETISQPSLVNLDYADVRAIMKSGGVATVGVGMADSVADNRALTAVNKALSNPLLDVDYTGATGALIQVIGGDDMTLDEINLVGERVAENMDPKATVMWGARVSPEFKDKLQVICIVTGVKSTNILGTRSRGEMMEERAERYSSELGIPVVC
ncbi:MAG: cell division protein FtsZ [Candidatus Aenigmarchaeota archaeon]|nr:cell division protein FtsZ [Candidatus Aenigmarchaeota archaeon]